MREAVISDIHGNRVILDAAPADIKEVHGVTISWRCLVQSSSCKSSSVEQFFTLTLSCVCGQARSIEVRSVLSSKRNVLRTVTRH